MRTHYEHDVRLKRQQLADLENQAASLERKLSDARVSLERELAESAYSRETALDQLDETCRCAAQDGGPRLDGGGDDETDGLSDLYADPEPARGYDYPDSDGPAHSTDGRTEVLVSHGRRGARYSRLSRGHKVAAGTAVLAVLVIILVLVLSGRGPSWPASVATVQSEAARACQNPDVRSEPGQVNFACAKATRQILWVFALMTSGDNPNFADKKTGRQGLEPITPAQGGEVAWSLNLHHPYDPANPIDSLGVAARAINNIIGGATVTGAHGKPVVRAGLEGHAANCLRYTGSAAITSRAGFPAICASPVIVPGGQAALVADVYQKWIIGATPTAAQNAAVLFENAKSPGNSQVQAILRDLSPAAPPA
jgi:hypothetical protein